MLIFKKKKVNAKMGGKMRWKSQWLWLGHVASQNDIKPMSAYTINHGNLIEWWVLWMKYI